MEHERWATKVSSRSDPQEEKRVEGLGDYANCCGSGSIQDVTKGEIRRWEKVRVGRSEKEREKVVEEGRE